MAFPLDAPEMVQALVAECPEPAPRADKPKRRKGKQPPVPFDPARRSGQSDDGSLAREVTVPPAGARNVSVTWRKDGAMGPALIEAVAFARLDSRLAAALLGHGPERHTTHQALADELGTVREMVTRLLKRFERDGLVALSRERITVLDAAGLRAVAQAGAA